MNIECENREIPCQHHNSRFPMLRYPRQNNTVHSDTFFSSARMSQNHTCSQMFIGETTDYMHAELLKSELSSFLALQDFTRKHRISHTIKTDNARTETAVKWTEHCRRHHIAQKYTEPRHPWQNYTEHAIRDLSVMVRRTMRKHKIPLIHHH